MSRDVRDAFELGALCLWAGGAFALLHLVAVATFRWLGMRSVPWAFDLIWTAVVLLSPVLFVACLLIVTWSAMVLNARRASRRRHFPAAS